MGFPSDSAVKSPPAMQEVKETWVRQLGQKGALKEGMATHSSILAWTTPWTEEPGGLQSIGSQRVRHDKRPSSHTESVPSQSKGK